jgi:hypothetical protein
MNDEIIYGEDITWGKYGKDIVPSPIYQVYRIKGIWIGDDESLWYSFEPGEGIEPSEIAIVDAEDPEKTYSKIEANKYGYAEGVVKVQITVSAQLKESYPAAIVNVDGKFYDLNYLNEPIEFFMNKNHRISIEWSEGLIETFRVVML